MKIIATHVTEQRTQLGIGERQRQGGHGLLVLPPHATLGGCFWGLVQSMEDTRGQNLIEGFASGIPNIGRDPDSAHTMWVEIDLPNANYESFDPTRLSEIQAACLLSDPIIPGAGQPNFTIYSERKFQLFGHRDAPLMPAQIAALAAVLPAPGNIPLRTALAQWLRNPGRTVANLPAIVHPGLGLTGGSANRVFQVNNLRSAEHSLWESVGRACCLANNVGLVIVPRGVYLSRSGGGRFVVVPNNLVHAQVKLRPRTVPWL